MKDYSSNDQRSSFLIKNYSKIIIHLLRSAMTGSFLAALHKLASEIRSLVAAQSCVIVYK